MTPSDSRTALATRCPACGASSATSVAGLCAACLVQLAIADPSEEPKEAPDLAPGVPPIADGAAFERLTIGNYVLLGELGRGGMGIVYRARQLTADRIVALKIMLPQLLPLPGMRARFFREVEAIARLDHPGILPIYEVGEYAGLPLFSMKLAESGALDQRVHALRGRWQAIAQLVARLAEAVEHAHARGILHRDLKPANVLFDAHDAPLVADFGLARLRATTAALTLPAAALGSPSYMAPEQVSAAFGDVGPATDVYGLGAILYELLCGAPPIQAEDAQATLRLVTTAQPAAMHSAGVPAELDAIARKCLAKRPADRYANAAALRADLGAWLEGRDALAARQARARRRWRVAAPALGGLLLVATGAAGWLWLETRSAPVTSAPDRDGLDDGAASAADVPASRRLGVIAFRNESGDRDDDYLTTIVTDDLLRDLRQIDTLDVLPFRIDATAARDDPGGIATQLGADALLTGDLQRLRSTVRVRARLWDARARRDVWTRTFEASGDVRTLRNDLALAIVTGLQIEMGDDVRRRLVVPVVTNDAEAYRHYLRGRYLLRWRRPETLREATREFRAALERDPAFARAHAGLAAVHALWVPGDPSPDGDPAVLAAHHAEAALALDANLSEPHAVLANLHRMAGRFVEAETAFRRALALDPRDASTLHFYGIHLYGVGKLTDALAIERRAVALDGASAQPMMWLAMLTTLRGSPEEARRLWRQTEELGATRPLSAAIVRFELGEAEPYAGWFHDRSERSGIPPSLEGEALLIDGMADPAARPAALEWLKRVERHVDPAFAIAHYAMLGALDDAFRVADGYDLLHDRWYSLRPTTLWAPRLAAFRADPRFATLVERWGFAEYWRRFGASELCELIGGRYRCR